MEEGKFMDEKGRPAERPEIQKNAGGANSFGIYSPDGMAELCDDKMSHLPPDLIQVEVTRLWMDRTGPSLAL